MRAMMRLLGGVALVAACAVGAGAQSVGVMGGWARPTLSGSDAAGASAMNGFAAGAFVTKGVGPMFAVEVDALYMQKGAAASASGVDWKLKLGYVEVPVMAKLIVPVPASRIQPAVFAGPYLGLKASCTASVADISASCGDGFKSTDLGLTFGGGVSFPLTARLSGLVQARYDMGLTSIEDATTIGDVTTSIDEKNRSLVVFAGVSLPIGR